MKLLPIGITFIHYGGSVKEELVITISPEEGMAHYGYKKYSKLDWPYRTNWYKILTGKNKGHIYQINNNLNFVPATEAGKILYGAK